MKRGNLLYGVVVVATLAVGWVWVTRVAGMKRIVDDQDVFKEPNKPNMSLPLDPWPDTSDNKKNVKLDETMPSLDKLAKKKRLSPMEKAQMAYQASFICTRNATDAVRDHYINRLPSTPDHQPKICKSAERLDANNGLYPMIEAIIRFQKAVIDTSGRMSRGSWYGYQQQRNTGGLSATPTATYQVIDEKQLVMAIDAFVRASKRPIRLYRSTVLAGALNKDAHLMEQHVMNIEILMAFQDQINLSGQRKMAEIIDYAGPQLVSMGLKSDAQHLLNALLPYCTQMANVDDCTALEALSALKRTEMYVATAEKMAISLNLPKEQQRYLMVSVNLKAIRDDLKQTPLLERDGGTLYNQAQVLRNGKMKDTPTKDQITNSRMFEYVMADQAALGGLVLLLMISVAAGLGRLAIWRLFCKYHQQPDLNMMQVYKRVLTWAFIVPLAIYTLGTQIAATPLRSSNMDASIALEKIIMIAAAISVPWIIFRFYFKSHAEQTDVMVPNRWFELLANSLGAVPSVILFIVWCVFLGRSVDADTGHSIYPMMIGCSTILWVCLNIAASVLKLRYRDYYALSTRYLLPLHVWSILFISVVLLPFLLSREVTLLRGDQMVIGSFKGTGITTALEQQQTNRLVDKLLEATNVPL